MSYNERRLGVRSAILDGELVDGDISLDRDGRIMEVGLASSGNGIAVPGFVDLQVNGFAGADFLLGGDYEAAFSAMAGFGVTAVLPTLITCEVDTLRAALDALGHLPPRVQGVGVLGLHLEGPFIAPSRMGAHPPAHRREPDPGMLGPIIESHPVRLVTMAPELPGGLAMIEELSARGTAVSVGHSEGTAQDVRAAFAAGAKALTHAFNAMAPIEARAPGPLGAALGRRGVSVMLIADGVHVVRENVRWLFYGFAAQMVLVTDAIAIAGSDQVTSAFGDQQVTLVDGAPRFDDGTLAGSTLTMDRAVRVAVDAGAEVVDAVNAASLNPAALIGERAVGRLVPGRICDVVLLDDDLFVRQTIVDGHQVGGN